jgi:hypothetical protein
MIRVRLPLRVDDCEAFQSPLTGVKLFLPPFQTGFVGRADCDDCCRATDCVRQEQLGSHPER